MGKIHQGFQEEVACRMKSAYSRNLETVAWIPVIIRPGTWNADSWRVSKPSVAGLLSALPPSQRLLLPREERT